MAYRDGWYTTKYKGKGLTGLLINSRIVRWKFHDTIFSSTLGFIPTNPLTPWQPQLSQMAKYLGPLRAYRGRKGFLVGSRFRMYEPDCNVCCVAGDLCPIWVSGSQIQDRSLRKAPVRAPSPECGGKPRSGQPTDGLYVAPVPSALALATAKALLAKEGIDPKAVGIPRGPRYGLAESLRVKATIACLANAVIQPIPPKKPSRLRRLIAWLRGLWQKKR